MPSEITLGFGEGNSIQVRWPHGAFPTLMIGDETYEEFVAREGYKDMDGNLTPLEVLVARDPIWAVNRIRSMRQELADLQDRISRMEH